MNEQEAIRHDAGVWDLRARVQQHMLLVEKVHFLLGGDPDANALAVAVADDLELWEDEELPWWVMESAEWAVEEVLRELAQAGDEEKERLAAWKVKLEKMVEERGW